MITLRKDRDIHQTDGGWFQARWHFSFDRYRDPENMGVGPLRVFNDDRLVPGATWPMHPHQDVEGITYVVEGIFRHEDSLGNGGILPAGSVQRMTLGSGALHSESNASDTEPLRFLQFWILPDTPSLPPENVQLVLDAEKDFDDRLRCVLAPARGHGAAEEGDEGALAVHQNARAFIGRPRAATSVARIFPEGRAGYLYVMDGSVEADGTRLEAGDAAKIFGPEDLTLTAVEDAHLILVDVPAQFRPVGVWAR